MGRVSAAIDAGALLDRSPWTGYQKLLTALAALAVIFDGFDIQILGFAIPSLMKEWGVARSAFAPVLALGLAGMAAGVPWQVTLATASAGGPRSSAAFRSSVLPLWPPPGRIPLPR